MAARLKEQRLVQTQTEREDLGMDERVESRIKVG